MNFLTDSRFNERQILCPGIFPAVFAGGHSGFFLKRRGKITAGCETQFIADLLNAHMGARKKDACMFYLCAPDIFGNAFAGFLLKFM